jgi:hypothetical protein
MPDKIDDLVDAALDHVDSSSSLEEISKAIEIAKSGSEYLKTNQEIQSSSAQIRSERLKTWASIMVPIVSILALLATVLTQMYQQHSQFQATRQQAEDTQWRDLLSSVQGGASKAISDVSLVPRLKSFFSSATYGSQARDLSKHLMGSLANDEAFRDLFTAVFPIIDYSKLGDLVDINRMMTRTVQEIHRKCEEYSLGFQVQGYHGLCSGTLNDNEVEQLARTTRNSHDILDTRFEYQDIYKELKFLSESILGAIKDLGGETKSANLDISGIYLYDVNASGLDFSRLDISECVFARVDLSNTKLTPEKFQNFDPTDSNWWDVASIDSELLQRSIQDNYPGYSDHEIIFGKLAPTKDYYLKRVDLLCRDSRAACEKLNLRFEERFVFVNR